MTDQPSQSVELLMALPDRSVAPLQTSLRTQLLEAMRTGRLTAGSRLPSTRQLALDLGIARGTVVEVYDQLINEGYLCAAQGAGTVVAALTGPAHDGPARDRPVAHLVDLRPGRADLRSFPRQTWARASAHVMRTLPDAALGEVDPAGALALRAELALHLGRTRHVVVDPDRVTVTTGVAHGLALFCRMLGADAGTVVAVEDPGDSAHCHVLRRHGLTLVDVPVDEEGLSVDALRSSGAGAVLVTPNPQFPTGVVMSACRRASLVAWAAEVDALVVEVDTDFQLRNMSEPSLHAALPQQVVHISSVNRTLVAGARLGWLVVPDALRHELSAAVREVGYATSVFDQHTLARMLHTGEYDRHVRRQRTAYRARRKALVDALAHHLPAWTVRGADAGLDLWVEPGGLVNEPYLATMAEQRGLLVATMSGLRRSADARGVVLSFAQLSDHAADSVVSSLAEAVALCC